MQTLFKSALVLRPISKCLPRVEKLFKEIYTYVLYCILFVYSYLRGSSRTLQRRRTGFVRRAERTSTSGGTAFNASPVWSARPTESSCPYPIPWSSWRRCFRTRAVRHFSLFLLDVRFLHRLYFWLLDITQNILDFFFF